MNLTPIYEDNHLLVVCKPLNMPVQEDASGDLDLLTALKQQLKEKYNKPGNVYLGLVHRLDRPVGGVMVFAKTSKAASRLSDQLRRGKIDKKYLAIVESSALPKQDTLRHFLLKDRSKNIVSVVPRGKAGAKEAQLRYKLVGRKDQFSLVEVTLLTGRSHQIRVQFASIDAPLWGDHKYGNGTGRQQLALWSSELTFEHPVKKEPLTFKLLPAIRYPWDLFLTDL